ncbi:MAG TPA: DUF418 domain-containing protein [Luteimonas sp.]|nr:DUF418 domain-containing protein [Luteimonas sp.]
MTLPTPGPVPGSQRLDLLDALRGFALAGVLLANLDAFSLYFFLPREAALALPTAAIDRWLDPANGMLVSGKFITLFSIMFGIGFALQMQRMGEGGRWRYLRRLAVLWLIGLLHVSLWWGDILRWYAVMGLVLLPLARLRPRTLAILGVALVTLPHAPLSLWWPGGWPLATQEQAFAAALATFSGHDPAALLHGNAWFAHWWTQSHWGMALAIPGRMLIGAAIGYSGVLSDPAAHARFWNRLLWLALPLGLALVLATEMVDYGWIAPPAAWPGGAAGTMLLRTVNQDAALLLGLGYAALFVKLFADPRWRRRLQPLAPVGRMALSNYLTHSVVGVAVFYGVALGVGPRWGTVAIWAVFLALFGAQVALSGWWLARFRFGPAEWLWRSLTYGRRQPMRRAGGEDATSTQPARP